MNFTNSTLKAALIKRLVSLITVEETTAFRKMYVAFLCDLHH